MLCFWYFKQKGFQKCVPFPLPEVQSFFFQAPLQLYLTCHILLVPIIGKQSFALRSESRSWALPTSILSCLTLSRSRLPIGQSGFHSHAGAIYLLFSGTPRRSVAPTQPHIQWAAGFFVALTLRMSGVIPPTPPAYLNGVGRDNFTFISFPSYMYAVCSTVIDIIADSRTRVYMG